MTLKFNVYHIRSSYEGYCKEGTTDWKHAANMNEKRCLTFDVINEHVNCEIVNWASLWDNSTYGIGDQRMLRRACASTQSRQSLRCSFTWSVEVDEGSDRKSDTGWLRMRVWRMRLFGNTSIYVLEQFSCKLCLGYPNIHLPSWLSASVILDNILGICAAVPFGGFSKFPITADSSTPYYSLLWTVK